MRSSALGILALALTGLTLAACGDKDGDEEGGVDDTAGSGEIVYPTGDRILMYIGAGGWEEDSTDKGGVDDIDARWKAAFGWNTDVNESWPEDLSPYRAIFLVGPGSTGTASFDPTVVEALSNQIAKGTRLIVMGENSMCGDAAVAQLLADLGTEMRFTGEAADANRLIDADVITEDLQVNEGVTEFRLKAPCWVDPSGGVSVGRDRDRNHYAGIYRVGNGGEIVLIGNFEFLDDGGLLEFGDNGTFADNLILIESGAGGSADSGE